MPSSSIRKTFYGDLIRKSSYPVFLVPCNKAGSLQLRLLSLPNYREQISKAALKAIYVPSERPEWDVIFQGVPFLVAVDMDLQRIEAAIDVAHREGYEHVVMVALQEQAEAVNYKRYRDTGKARVFSLTSVEAKMVYSLLINRFQLSRRNNWINEYGEVFVYYPRANMAQDINISEKRVTTAFRQLIKHKLIWEKRCGLGRPNEIYLVEIDHLFWKDGDAADPDDPQDPPSPLETDGTCEEEVTVQDPSQTNHRSHQEVSSESGKSTAVEHPILRTNKKEKSKKEFSYHKSVNSVYDEERDREEQELTEIIDSCEFSLFQPEEAGVMEQAIERLYYSNTLRIGNITLPQKRVRLRLRQLNDMIVQETLRKLHRNPIEKIKNSIAYIMTVLFNTIAEIEGDLMIDPYLNGLQVS